MPVPTKQYIPSPRPPAQAENQPRSTPINRQGIVLYGNLLPIILDWKAWLYTVSKRMAAIRTTMMYNRTGVAVPFREKQAMQNGVVKWFNNTKGYGFIQSDESSVDIFAHFSNVTMEGFKTLKRGQKVSFELVDGPKGKQAQNIQPLSD